LVESGVWNSKKKPERRKSSDPKRPGPVGSQRQTKRTKKGPLAIEVREKEKGKREGGLPSTEGTRKGSRRSHRTLGGEKRPKGTPDRMVLPRKARKKGGTGT